MKKLLIAAMAVLTITALSACGNESAVNDETTASDISVTTIATEGVDEDTETEDTTSETEAEENNAVAAEGELFQGTGYTLSINSEKWLDMTEYIEEISKTAEDMDIVEGFDAESLNNMGDAMFYYSADMASNFNVVTQEVGDLGDNFDMSLLNDVIEAQYSQINGCTYLGGEVITVNGYDCFKAEISADASVFGADLKMAQCMFINGTSQYVVTFTAGTENFDSVYPEFEAVLNSLTFTK